MRRGGGAHGRRGRLPAAACEEGGAARLVQLAEEGAVVVAREGDEEVARDGLRGDELEELVHL